ncbi:MAG: phosphate signaling complex protein PhoU [Candidatus Margulisiibacteriota bacterium]
MTRDNFHNTLKEAENKVLLMGEIIHDLLSDLIFVFQSKVLDADKVREIITKESRLDDLEFEIEKMCMELLALQQPMAIDLRTIMCIIKISIDLERIGDHIRKVGRKTRKVVELQEFGDFSSLAEMTILLRQMVEQIMIAFKEKNVKLSQTTQKFDGQINQIQRSLFIHYIDKMRLQPDEQVISSGIYLLFITRFLERIGDHVQNIGERINFMVTGDIKQLKGQSYPAKKV